MKVFTAGVFDIIHVGHINMLLFCRQIAGPNGQVSVSLDTDYKVKQAKGDERPVFPLNYRENAIKSINYFGNKVVDFITFHDSNYQLEGNIFNIKPDYIVACDEYKGRVVGADLAEVIYFKKDERFSSTKIIEACMKNQK